MSPEVSGTGRKPFCLYHWTIRSSPWVVKIFAALMSASVFSGFFGEQLHPSGAAPGQHLESARLHALLHHRSHSFEHVLGFRVGGEEERNPNTLNPSSIDERPGSISRPPCS